MDWFAEPEPTAIGRSSPPPLSELRRGSVRPPQHSGRRPVDIGEVAGNRARTCALARRHSALKSQPQKFWGAL